MARPPSQRQAKLAEARYYQRAAKRMAFLSLLLSRQASHLEPDERNDSDSEQPNVDDEDEDEVEGLRARASTFMHIAVLWFAAAARLKKEAWARGPRGAYRVTKSADSLPILLQKSIDNPRDLYWKTFARMDRLSFDRVVQLLENHPLTRQIFISTNRSKAQRPVYVQLLAFLGYNAFPDTNAIIVTFTLGLGHGTLALYRRRVSRALRSLSTEFVKWPDLEERAVLRAKYGDMFEGMLGIVDGSLIEMAEIPRVDGAWYYSGRKKLYGFNIQCVCCRNRGLISYKIGDTAAAPDASVFRKSALMTSPDEFFEPGEYLLGDKGYPNCPHIVQVWPDNDCCDSSTRKERISFNRELSRRRVVIENYFEGLKGRFRSLKRLPGREPRRMLKEIEALLVVHQILHSWGDLPEQLEDQDWDVFQRQVEREKRRHAVAVSEAEAERLAELRGEAVERAALGGDNLAQGNRLRNAIMTKHFPHVDDSDSN